MQQTSDLDSTILRLPEQLKGCVGRLAGHYCPSQNCGCSSVGRAPPCQGGRREFEPRHPLQPRKLSGLERVRRSFSEGGPPPKATAGRPCHLLSRNRLRENNTSARRAIYASGLRHTTKVVLHIPRFRPWFLIAYFAFAEEKTAIAFERYLNSGSGRAFINRHFV